MFLIDPLNKNPGAALFIRMIMRNTFYFQGRVNNTAKRLITEAVVEILDIENFASSNTFRIADLGCSVGPNTFFAVQNIIEAVQFKYQCQGLDSQLPEFQVLFSDHTSNDFNTLFSSLPLDRKYYDAGVPTIGFPEYQTL